MVGLVVTPTMEYSSTRDCRFPLRMRSRERSSSQTATPADDSSASFSFCAMSLPFWGVSAPLQGPAASVRAVGQRGPSAVAGRVRQAAGGGDGAGRHGVPGPRRLDALAGGGDDGLVGEAELLVQHRVGRTRPVVGEADDPAG